MDKLIKLKVACVAILALLVMNLSAQNWQWGVTIGGPSFDSNNGITTDNWGNVYMIADVTGNFTVNSQTHTGYGFSDIVLVKYRSNGQFCWLWHVGGADEDEARSLACDPNGNIYVGGSFEGTSNFGPNTLISLGDRDIFLAKLDSTGTCLWAKGMGSASPGSESGSALMYSALDNSIVMVGAFYGPAVFDDTTMTPAGDADIYLTKWSPAGQRLMSRGYGYTNDDVAGGVAVDAAGQLYICGRSDGQAILFKTNLAGTLIWTRVSSSNFGGFCSASDVTVDLAGNVTMSGSYSQGTIPTFTNITLPAQVQWASFLAQYDQNGNIRWARESACTNTDIFGGNIDLDLSGNIIVGNGFLYDFYTDTTIVMSFDPSTDGIVYKYNQDGELIWRVIMSDSATEPLGDVHYHNGSIYAGGIYNGQGTYGPVVMSATTTNASLIKLSDCTPMSSTTVSGLPLINNLVCPNTPVTLSSSFTAAGFSYQWTSYGVPLSGETNSSFSPTADGVFAINLTDPNGCTYPSAYVGLTFVPLPDSTFTTTAYGTSCRIDSVLIMTATQPSCTYQWLLNNQVISGATSMSYMVNIPGTYKAIITNSFGCSVTSVPAVISSIGPLPNMTVSNDTSICAGESIQLYASGANLYGWSPTSTLSSGTSPSPVATPSTTTSYIVTGSTGFCWVSDTVVVTVNPVPSPYPQLTFPNWYLAANCWPVQWYLNDTLIPNETWTYYQPVNNGVYHFTFTDTNGCVWQSNDVTVMTAGIAENFMRARTFVVYPNPSCGTVNISSINGNEISSILLCNQLGEIVKEYTLLTPASTFSMDITELQNGLYLLNIQGTSASEWIPVIRQQ